MKFDEAPPLWSPPHDVRETTLLGRYLDWLAADRGLKFESHDELWRWSVADLDGFWASIWDFFDVRAHEPYRQVRIGETMPDVRWFPGARLNYAEHLLGDEDDTDRVAIYAHSQTREPLELTFRELREQVAGVRAGLQALGVGPGDRVVAYLPNIPETIVAFIATASLGAIWSSCAPEFGPRSVIDRFAQIEPKVLFAVSGYGFRDRFIDRRAQLAEIRDGLPTLENVIDVPYGGEPLPAALTWAELLVEAGPLAFDAVAADHPLYVLFSSGTTGLPKAIVHGHAGILVEHLKIHGFGLGIGPETRFLQFTTTGWMMWNFLVSSLLLRSAIGLFDGDPTWPDLGSPWQLAAETGTSVVGTSPAFVMACRKAGVALDRFDLAALDVVFTAGSPLPGEGYRYLYEQLGPELLLINGSGGTDVCSAFVSGSAWQPVYEGEISGPCLGADVRALDQSGEVLVGTPGELVIAQPMPSMPLGFWNDPDRRRERAAYYEDFPGLWRHGDWITITPRRSCVISGRSDATLNRGGVRLGTGEIYSVVEDLPEVSDSLVVHLEDPAGGPGELLLFVAPSDGAEVDDALRGEVVSALRAQLSPRHAPDIIVAVPGIPRTLTGKKLEAPVKRLLLGAPPESVASRDALAAPEALEAFVDFATSRRTA
jgi:acetoacetyl-CoA synthetase